MGRPVPIYFAYGSNLSQQRLQRRVGPVATIGRALLADHRHAFSKPGLDGTGKGNVAPAVGWFVHGAAYLVSDAQLDVLDVFEGGYRRAGVSVRIEAALHEAVTFIALAPREDAPAPSRVYLHHYRIGFAEHGIDPLYARAVLAEGERRR